MYVDGGAPILVTQEMWQNYKSHVVDVKRTLAYKI